VGGTVEPLEPVTQVAQPDAALVHALQGAGRHAETIVADAELEAAVGQDGLDAHRAAAQLAREAVLHRVLDQRLEDQVRDRVLEARRVDARLDAQPVAETSALDVEVGARHLELVGKRHEVQLAVSQHVAEHLRQPLDARLGSVGVGADELRDRVQAVEEEVRVDLGAQRGELRGRGQLDQLALAVPEPEHALPVLMVADERQEHGRTMGINA